MLSKLLPFFLASVVVACTVQQQAASDTRSESDETAAGDDDDDAPKSTKKKADAGTTTPAPAPAATDAGAPAPALTTWTADISETAQAIWGAKQTIADGTTVPCFAVVFDNAKLVVKTDAAGNVASVKFDAALDELMDNRCTGATPPDAPASYSYEGTTPGKITAQGAATNNPQTSFEGELHQFGDSAIFATDIARTDAQGPDAWKMHLEIILTKAAGQ